MDFDRILHTYFPGASRSFDILDDEQKMYDSIVFHDDNKKPSFGQFVLWQQELDQQDKDTEYQRKRAAEYPSCQDCMEALWEMMVEGDHTKANELQSLREKIKAKYPKV